MLNPYIFLIVLLFLIIYRISNNFFIEIDTKKSYTIGILKNNMEHLTLTNEMLNLCTNDYTLKFYSTQQTMLEALNNNSIQFSLVYEDEMIDATLGLNSYNNKLNNIRFITGLFYNYYYFITNIFYKTSDYKQKINNIEDIKNFYSIYNRNIIIGTEPTNSISHINLIRILYINGLKPVNITNLDNLDNQDNQDNQDNHRIVYYYTSSFDDIACKFINNVVDGVFVVKTNNNNTIKQIIDKKDIIFLDMNFKNTIFNDLFSHYYYSKNITISGSNNTLDSQYIVKTISIRIVIMTNNNTDEQPIKELIECYYTHNNHIISNLVKQDIENHMLFKPIDMFYVNDNIPIHNTAITFYKSIGYIIDPSLKKTLENKNVLEKQYLKQYWKYDKIGLQKFNI